MAWRIDEQVIRGEIDNRTRGKTTGRIWFVGRDNPVVLDLTGNPWRDLAGHLLRFTNPMPKPGLPEGLADEQRGTVGDITASRKVKVPDVPMAELMELVRQSRPFPWHWGNTLYLEWHSASNGRVVIETASYSLKLEGIATWTMSEEDEVAQRRANGEAMSTFMDRLTMTSPDDSDDDAPHSRAESTADKESERMNRLLDRVLARMERESDSDFETIMEEESARLRRECGEPEPELTPEELEQRREWSEELDAIETNTEALTKSEDASWQDEEQPRHPLVTRSTDLAVRLHREVKGWLPEGASAEHPLSEIVTGVMIAGAKLAGALTNHDFEWPPEELFAGDVLVRLKKARGHLRDALAGVDAADLENLATPGWRAFVRHEIRAILAEVEELIDEVRRVLSDEE
jgi:hypothetical protein